MNPKRKTKRGELARDAVFTPTEVRPMLNAAGFNFSKVPSSEHLRVSGNLPNELKSWLEFLTAGACTTVPCLRFAVRWRLSAHRTLFHFGFGSHPPQFHEAQRDRCSAAPVLGRRFYGRVFFVCSRLHRAIPSFRI